MTLQEITVGDVPVRALRVTYVGELGWELYCPTEYGLGLWRAIWEAGAGARHRRRRLPGDRLDAAGEGLPRLGRRHHPGRVPRGRRRRLLREARQGRVHRPRGAGRRGGGRAAAPARLHRPRRPAAGRARQRAGAGRRRRGRPGDDRRLRLHGRALDRLRLPAGGARRAGDARSRSRSSAAGSRARSRPSRSSIRRGSGSGPEPAPAAGRRGCARCPRCARGSAARRAGRLRGAAP